MRKTRTRDWIKERWEAGLSDALGQNILLYISTLLISILLSLITTALSQETMPVKFDLDIFLRTLADCVMPTAITMGLGTFIQNYDIVSKNKVRRSGLNVVLMLLTLIYPFTYMLLRLYGVPWVDGFVFAGSSLIVIVGLFSISQITREKETEQPSLFCPSQDNSADQKALRLEQAGRRLDSIPKESLPAVNSSEIGGGSHDKSGMPILK